MTLPECQQLIIHWPYNLLVGIDKCLSRAEGPVINNGEGGGGELQKGRGGKSSFTHTKQRGGGTGSGIFLVMLKAEGHKTFLGSFNMGAWNFIHTEKGHKRFSFFKRGDEKSFTLS